MPARNGQQYVESLRKSPPCVYLDGRRVADVTAEPIFQEPIRLTAGFYAQYPKEPLLEMVERALGHRDGLPIPISPADAGAPVPYQPGTRGMAGTYAATSLPARDDPRP
jgi:hypothetical protein